MRLITIKFIAKRYLALIWLVLFHFGQVEAKDLPIGNDKSMPANVFIMLDTSGSMAWVVNQDTYPANLADSRIEKAKSVIKGLVNNPLFKDKVNFGLMQWNFAANAVPNPADWSCNYYNPHWVGGDPSKATFAPYATKVCGEKIEVNLSTTGGADINNMIDSIMPGGGTNLDAAMLKAKDYLYSSSSPVNTSLTCQKNIIILISDGDWTGNQAPGIVSDFNAKGIQTYAIGFASSITNTSNYRDIATAGGTGQPFFVQDASQLSTVLTQVLVNVSSVPQTLQQVSGKDALIKAGFLPVTNHQWNGYLKKQTLDSNGAFVDLWEAGSLLNTRNLSDRKIWTALSSLSVSTNNFIATNASLLSSAFYAGYDVQPPSADAVKLINFVRGGDSYNEFGGTRWKLADIYHSKPVAVGVPNESSQSINTNTESYYRSNQAYSNFVTQWKSRREVIYVGANDGMLHAFDASSGAELWAFVPPPLLNKLNNMNAGQDGISFSTYGVDGSPQVKDIYFQGAWHTVLICGLGRGGKAIFALDITDPDNPKHLYAIDNDIAKQKIYYWDASGVKTSYNYNQVNANMDYSKLGDTWAEPTFVLMPDASGSRWVFALGSGYAGLTKTVTNATVFIIDAANGQILKNLNISDSGVADFANGIVSPMTKVGADNFVNANYKGAILYFTDLQSKLWKLNLTDQDTLYHLEQITSASATLSNDRLSFNQLSSIDMSGLSNLYLMFGTGNLLNASRLSDAVINKLYAVKDKDFPRVTNADGIYPFDSSVKLQDLSQSSGQCSASYDRGWYLNLNGYKDTAGVDIGKNWRVLNSPLIFQQKIYLEIYQPNQNNPCAAGFSRILIIDLLCGNMIVSSKVIDGAANQLFYYKGNLYLTNVNDQTVNVNNIPDIKKFVTTYNRSKKTPIKFRIRVH